MRRRDFLKLLAVSPAVGLLPKSHKCEWRTCGSSFSTGDGSTDYSEWHEGRLVSRLHWDRKLTDEEVSQLYANPYIMFNGSHISSIRIS